MIKLFSQKEPFVSENGLITPKNKMLFWAFGLVAGSWLICILVSTVVWFLGTRVIQSPATIQSEVFKQFTSETEFRTYLARGQEQSSVAVDAMVGRPTLMKSTAEMMPAELPMAVGGGNVPDRVSETNVQVKGIDEPDIVKTDGKQIYVSGEQQYYFAEPMMKMMVAPDIYPVPPQPIETTQVIQGIPVEQMKSIGKIDKRGDLLLAGTTLLVLGNQMITGFDVSVPESPKEVWSYTLADNRQITAARLIDGKVVLVSSIAVYGSSPCPIPLFKATEQSSIVACTSIWRPETPIPSDTTYTVLSIDPKKGTIENQVSFVGSASQTVVYVSANSVYVSFTKTKDWGALTAEFLTADTNTMVSAEIKERLKKVLALDISQMAKQVEVEQLLNQYAMGMSDDDRLKWETERTNQMSAFIDQRKRELERTSIAKIRLSDFTIAAIGEVPGHPLNQFSLDEYNDTFRIATTVGGRGLGGGALSGNDVYILNQEMKTVGSVTDLGKEERIYAVRFMGNRGYVVTFKETDPLYVLDLSKADAPIVTGELKIPGYSSYLHPLKDGLLLGIGKEENQVKISLFDVVNAAKPIEIDTYLLSDYWSEILSTHKAFLQDAKHTVFFLPSEKGGYVFSYADNTLKLVKVTEGFGIKRALYINDNLYFVGSNKITVISEKDWQTIKTIEW